MSESDDNLQSGLEGTARFQILHAARQLIAGQLGVIAASRLLSHFHHDAEPKVAEVLLTFVGIDSETDALPIGTVRGNWSPGTLKSKDREIAEAEQFYRETALNAAAELLRLLDVPS